jgi:ElaA protein
MSSGQLRYNFYTFGNIPIEVYHHILALRCAVFVVEQNCPYQEVDDLDLISTHLEVFSSTDGLIATARIVPPNMRYAEPSIGRVAVAIDQRGKGYGKKLMVYCIEECRKRYGQVPIRISAQSYLEKFYTELGFVSTGKRYLEDNIPHLEMVLK